MRQSAPSRRSGVQLAALEIPAQAEFVSLARLVVGSLADDRYALSDDQLDNLKLAVSEACVLAAGPRPTDPRAASNMVAVVCTGADDHIEVVIDGHGFRFDDDAEIVLSSSQVEIVVTDRGDLESGFGRRLGLPFIGSLVDGVVVEPTDRGNRLRITILCERSEEL